MKTITDAINDNDPGMALARMGDIAPGDAALETALEEWQTKQRVADEGKMAVGAALWKDAKK